MNAHLFTPDERDERFCRRCAMREEHPDHDPKAIALVSRVKAAAADGGAVYLDADDVAMISGWL